MHLQLDRTTSETVEDMFRVFKFYETQWPVITCGPALYLPVYRLSTASLVTAIAWSTTGCLRPSCTWQHTHMEPLYLNISKWPTVCREERWTLLTYLLGRVCPDL